MHYFLNPIFRLDSIDNIEINPDFVEQSKKLKSKHLLINESKGSILLINESIHQFLSYFSSPINFENLLELYSQQNLEVTSELNQLLKNFLEQMKKRKIIISTDTIIEKIDKAFKFKIGDTIDYFEIEACVANKSNVDIYKVKDSEGRLYAIKLVSESKFNENKKFKKSVRLLEEEFSILNKIKSIPEVVNAIGFYKKENFYYMIMEYVEGISISKWLKNMNPSLNARINLISQILGVFSELHKIDVIHGDIHPSNFLVYEDQVKIIDFGLGIKDNLEENEIIKLGGVPSYMPPERVRKQVFGKFKNPSTNQSEVYQLGALFYHILYEKVPFSCLTWKELSNEIINKEPVLEKKTQQGESIDPKYLEIIQKALLKEPQNRFSNAAEMEKAWKN